MKDESHDVFKVKVVGLDVVPLKGVFQAILVDFDLVQGSFHEGTSQ